MAIPARSLTSLRARICRLEGVGVDKGGDARHLCDLRLLTLRARVEVRVSGGPDDAEYEHHPHPGRPTATGPFGQATTLAEVDYYHRPHNHLSR